MHTLPIAKRVVCHAVDLIDRTALNLVLLRHKIKGCIMQSENKFLTMYGQSHLKCDLA